jgi:DNA-binding MarR family transcriptional regulator
MIVLHQSPQGIAPSVLAAKTGVTRATISVMIRRMVRDGEVISVSDDKDKRGKKLTLTPQGREFMDKILPNHYARISKKMGKLTESEQQDLIRLLEKLSN